MAIISGILWKDKTEKVDFLINELVHNTKTRVNNILSTQNFNHGFVVASLRNGESITEKITFQSTSCLVGRMFLYPPENDFQNLGIKYATNEIPTSIDDLKKNYWGRYVGVEFDSQQPKVCLLRDPQGLATFYWTQHEEAILFSSDLTLLYDLIKENIEINDEYFLKFILGKIQFSLLTPFKNIYEVPAGCNLVLQPEFDPIASSFWNPLSEKILVRKNFDSSQISQEIINRLQYVVSCWASGPLGICLNLSGGLDSSALLLLLSKTMPQNKQLLALNYRHSLINASDESEEAQKIADFCKVPLQVFDWSACLPLTSISKKVRWERPYTELINQETFYLLPEFIKDINQYEFMDGQGGDHLFLMPPPFEVTVDYFYGKGMRGLHSIIKNLSHYYRQSFWSSYKAFFDVLKEYKIPSLSDSYAESSLVSWLNVSKEVFVKDISHTWSSHVSASSLPGKKYHYNALREASFYRGQPQQYGNNLILHPLLSQPLIEYVLSLPTYLFFNKDYDRILFRQAINEWKPNPFVWRKTKGETSGVIQLGLRKHFSRVCELCLEGYLAHKGLINKDLLYEELLAFSYGKPVEIWPLLNVLACEIWFENWEFI